MRVLKTVTYCRWLLFGLASDKKTLPPFLMSLLTAVKSETIFFQNLA